MIESGVGSTRVIVWKFRDGREARISCDAGTNRIEGKLEVSFLLTAGRAITGDDEETPSAVFDRAISAAAGVGELVPPTEPILDVVCDLRLLPGLDCVLGGLCAALSAPGSGVAVAGCPVEEELGDNVFRLGSGPGLGVAVSRDAFSARFTSGLLLFLWKSGRLDLDGLGSAEDCRAVRRLLRRRSLLGRVEDEGFEGDVDSMGALEFADIEEGEADCPYRIVWELARSRLGGVEKQAANSATSRPRGRF